MFHLKDGYFSIKTEIIYIITTLSVVILLINTGNYCIGDELSDRNKEMALTQKDIINKKRFINISTAPSCIKFKLKDEETNQIINILLENTELAEYLAGVRYDKSGRTLFPKNFKWFIENEYIPFLIKNEGDIKELRISDFPKNIASGIQFDKKNMRDFLYQFTYHGPLTIEKLGFNSEEKLINTYFRYDKNTNCWYLKKEYYLEFNNNAAFISLLIDLNYYVGHMDIAPILYIQEK